MNNRSLNLGIESLDELVNESLFLSERAEMLRKHKKILGRKGYYRGLLESFRLWRTLVHKIISRECVLKRDIGKYTFVDKVEILTKASDVDEEKISQIEDTVDLLIEKIGNDSHLFKSSQKNYFFFKGLMIDVENCIIKYKDFTPEIIKFDGVVYKILKTLIENKGRIVKHEDILNVCGKKRGVDSSDLFRLVKKTILRSGVTEEEFWNIFMKNKGYGLMRN